MLRAPTATHKLADWQEAPPCKWLAPSPPVKVVVQAAAPPVGLVALATLVATSSARQYLSLRHVSATSGKDWSTPWAPFHAPTPPVGSVELKSMFPALPEAAARQSSTVGQATALKLSSLAGGSTRSRFQDVAPPVGSVDTKSAPFPSAATQSVEFGQDIESTVLEPSILVTLHLEAPPEGSREVTTLPFRSPAAQKVRVGQETPYMYWLPSTSTRSQVLAPPLGLVEMTTEPSSSTATHNFTLGHAMPLSALVPSTPTTLHAGAPAVGSVETTACPSLSTATHRCALGQDTPISPFGLERVTSFHAAGLRGAPAVVVVVVVGATVVVVGAGDVGGTAALLEGPEEQPAAAKARRRIDATLTRRAECPFI